MSSEKKINETGLRLRLHLARFYRGKGPIVKFCDVHKINVYSTRNIIYGNQMYSNVEKRIEDAILQDRKVFKNSPEANFKE